jgi:hypothetical protein
MHDLISFLSQNDKLVTSWTAIAALFVSFISIVIAVVNMGMQRAHNRKSVLPIANLSFGDYETAIFVRLQNVGVGPMIVESLVVAKRDKNDESTGKAIIDFMPELPSGHNWSHFVHDIDGRAISAKDHITLILLRGDPNDDVFVAIRRDVRRALSNLSVTVEYKNVYSERMPSASRHLGWFGRHVDAQGGGKS